jgi:hypothetical protein
MLLTTMLNSTPKLMIFSCWINHRHFMKKILLKIPVK